MAVSSSGASIFISISVGEMSWAGALIGGGRGKAERDGVAEESS